MEKNFLPGSSFEKITQDEIDILSVAVDQSANVIIITGTDGNIEYVNRSFTYITGYTAEEVIGKNPRILKSGMQSKAFYEDLWDTLKKGRQWKGEFQNQKKTGEIFWESAIITPVKNKKGEVAHYIAIKEDITKQKKVERSLRESEEQYKSMVSNIPGVLYRCGTDSNRTVYNITDAVKTLTGYDAEDFLYNNKVAFAQIIHHDDLDRVMRMVCLQQNGPKQYAIEYRILTFDRQIKWVSDNGGPVFDEKGNIKWLDGFIFDITERIVALEELRKAKIQAEEANKAKSEFLANISHEIRTPLNTVLGFTELLENMTLDVNQLKYLHTIKSSGKNLMTLINDLLDLSKIEAGKVNLQYAPFRINELLDEIRNIFSQKISQKGIEYIENIDDQIPVELIFDETRLRQILINLVGNAIKFTHTGHIEIKIKVTSWKMTNGVPSMDLKIKIADTGIGIPAESFKVIFDSFRQQSQLNSRQYEGTGLGLAITKRLVEAMNGKIELQSKVGKGTTFSIFFPGVVYLQKSAKNIENELSFENQEVDKVTAHYAHPENIVANQQEGQQGNIMKKTVYNQLLNDFEQRLFRQWKHFHVKKPLKEIKAFAQEIIHTGRTHKIGFLIEYGEKLNLTIENFDIEEMQIILEEFTDLLNKLKKIPHEP